MYQYLGLQVYFFPDFLLPLKMFPLQKQKLLSKMYWGRELVWAKQWLVGELELNMSMSVDYISWKYFLNKSVKIILTHISFGVNSMS